jgi:class 3 adenylate cyclase
MKPIKIHETAYFNLPAEILWKYLADTDQLNRNIGLPDVSFVPLSEPVRKGYYNAVIRFLGIKIRYEEYPFDFIAGDYYEVKRGFKSGPFKTIEGGVKLLPESRGTRLNVYTIVTPRNLIGYILAHTALKKKATRDIVAFIRHLEQQFLLNRDINSLATLRPPQINDDELINRLNRLKSYPVSQDLVDKLENFLKNSSDLEVTRIRPFELAYQWGHDPMELLRIFLYAAKAGVLDLIWHVLCPNCRAATQEVSKFYELRPDSHCSTCQIRFDSDFSKSVEALFSVHSSIRVAHKAIYCIGGPANMPQIQAQFRIQPQAKRDEKVAFENGKVRIRSYHFKNIIYRLISNDAESPAHITVHATPEGLAVDDTKLKAGTVEIHFINDLDDEILIVIEHENYLRYTATAAQVITLQEFRDLFPSVTLSPGIQIAFSDLVLLFTDLRSSTAMYETVGDSMAFEFVQNHFKFITGIARKYNGGIVKTMGDAVMASFINPKDAFQAALDIQLEWNSFIENENSNANVRLKIGLHKGTAYAVNENENQDYFGSMVNEASRIESKSNGGDIVFSKDIFEDPGVKFILSQRGLTPETFTTQLKGLVEDRTLYRVQVLS